MYCTSIWRKQTTSLRFSLEDDNRLIITEVDEPPSLKDAKPKCYDQNITGDTKTGITKIPHFTFTYLLIGGFIVST